MLFFLAALEPLVRKKKVLFTIAATWVYFFIGLGYEVGVDWVAYLEAYDSGRVLHTNFELGYNLLNYLTHYFVPFWGFVFIVKILFLWVLCRFIRQYSALPTAALVIFIGVSYIFINDTLRQMLAVMIFLYCFLYIKKNGFYLVMILAALFHASIFILLPYKILFWLKNHFKAKAALLTILALLLGVFIIDIISYFLPLLPSDMLAYKVGFYLQSASTASYAVTAIRVLFLAYIVFSVAVKKHNTLIIGNQLVHVFLLFSLLMLIIECFFIQLPIVAQRTRMYLGVFPIILFCNHCAKLSMSALRWSLIMFAVAFCFAVLVQFSYGPMGEYYLWDMNYVIQALQGFPENDHYQHVHDFWINNE